MAVSYYGDIDVTSFVHKMSFKSLACAVSVQCQEIKQALASISYFDTWDATVVAECCRVSSIAEYPPGEIILGPDIGTSHTVYFILEGVCKMVQSLLIEVKINSRQKTLHKLYKFPNSKTLDSKSAKEDFSSRLLSQKQLFQCDKKFQSLSDETKNSRTPSEGEPEGERKEPKLWRPECAEPAAAEESNGHEETDDVNVTAENQSEADVQISLIKGNPASEEKSEKDSTEDKKSTFLTRLRSENAEPSVEPEPEEEFLIRSDHHLRVLEECKKRGKETEKTWVSKKAPLPVKPKNVECFFVETGFLLKGACFGLEKCQKENFILSTTKVKCLKIPRRFLFEHNPCYTWNRILLFHSLYLPRDEEILENLRSDRMWKKRKEKQSAETASRRNIHNSTSSSEVPYSVRLGQLL